MEAENKKILLVEDDPNFGAILKDYLYTRRDDAIQRWLHISKRN